MYINNLGLKSGCQIWKTASCITGMKSNSVEIIGRGSMFPCVRKLTNGLLPARRQEKKILTSCIFHHIALNYIKKNENRKQTIPWQQRLHRLGRLPSKFSSRTSLPFMKLMGPPKSFCWSGLPRETDAMGKRCTDSPFVFSKSNPNIIGQSFFISLSLVTGTSRGLLGQVHALESVYSGSHLTLRYFLYSFIIIII